jgi:hypothetical protein
MVDGREASTHPLRVRRSARILASAATVENDVALFVQVLRVYCS